MAGEDIVRVDVVFDVSQAEAELGKLTELTRNLGEIKITANFGDIEAQVQAIRDVISQPINLEVRLAGLDGAAEASSVSTAFEGIAAAAAQVNEVKLNLDTTSLANSIAEARAALATIASAITDINGLAVNVDFSALTTATGEARSSLETVVSAMLMVNETPLVVNTTQFIDGLAVAETALELVKLGIQQVNELSLTADISQLIAQGEKAEASFDKILAAAERVNSLQLAPDLTLLNSGLNQAQIRIQTLEETINALSGQNVGSLDFAVFITSVDNATKALVEAGNAASKLSQIKVPDLTQTSGGGGGSSGGALGGLFSAVTSLAKGAGGAVTDFSNIATRGITQLAQSSGVGGQAVAFLGSALRTLGIDGPIATAAVAALTVALFALHNSTEIADAVHNVAAQLGITKDAADKLAPTMLLAFDGSIGTIQQTTAAFIALEREFGKTWDASAIVQATDDLVEFNKKLGGSDKNVQEQARLFKQWGLDAEGAEKATNAMVVSVTKFGGSASRLTQDLRAAGPVLGAIGLNPEEAIILAGQFESVGINLSEVTLGLNKFSQNARKFGIDVREDVVRTFDLIREADAETGAALASDIFGTRANQSQKIATGIKTGDIDINELNQIADDPEALNRLKEGGETLSDTFQKLKNNITSAFQISGIIDAFQGFLQGVNKIMGVINFALARIRETVEFLAPFFKFIFGVSGGGDDKEKEPEKNTDGSVVTEMQKKDNEELAKAVEVHKRLVAAGKANSTDDEFTAKYIANQKARNDATELSMGIDQRKKTADIEIAQLMDRGDLSKEDISKISFDSGQNLTEINTRYKELRQELGLSELSQKTYNDTQREMLILGKDGVISNKDLADTAQKHGDVIFQDLIPGMRQINQDLQEFGGLESDAGQRVRELTLAMYDQLGYEKALAAAKRETNFELAIAKKLGSPDLGTALTELNKNQTKDKKDDTSDLQNQKDALQDQIDALKDQEAALKEALDDEEKAIKKAADAQIAAIDKVIAGIDAQLDALDRLKKGQNDLTVDERAAHENRLADLQDEAEIIRTQTNDLGFNYINAKSRAAGADTVVVSNTNSEDAAIAAAAANVDLAASYNTLTNAQPDLIARANQVAEGIAVETAALKDQNDAVKELTVSEQRLAAEKRRALSNQLMQITDETAGLARERAAREVQLKGVIAESNANPNAVGSSSRKDAAQQGLDTLDEYYANRLSEIVDRRRKAQTEFDDNEAKIAGDAKARAIRIQEDALKDQKKGLEAEKKAIQADTRDRIEAIKDQIEAIDDAYDAMVKALEAQKKAIEKAIKDIADAATAAQEKGAVSLKDAGDYLQKQLLQQTSDLSQISAQAGSLGVQHVLGSILDPNSNTSVEDRFRFIHDLLGMTQEERKVIDLQYENIQKQSATRDQAVTGATQVFGPSFYNPADPKKLTALGTQAGNTVGTASARAASDAINDGDIFGDSTAKAGSKGTVAGSSFGNDASSAMSATVDTSTPFENTNAGAAGAAAGTEYRNRFLTAASDLSKTLANAGVAAGLAFDNGLVIGLALGDLPFGNGPSNTVWRIGVNMVKRMKDALGIKSPSSEAFAMAGHFVDGMVGGLKDHGTRLEGAATDIMAPLLEMTRGDAIKTEVTSRMLVTPSNQPQTVELHPKDIDRIIAALREGPIDKPKFLPRRPVGVR